MSETALPNDELIADLEEAMRDVVDPELGINVVDLGLVYGISVEKKEASTQEADGAAPGDAVPGDAVQGNPAPGGTVALIDMTLTSAACPLTDVIEDQTLAALVGTGLVSGIKINWVWNPPWGPDKITDDGRDQLRALGFTV